MFYNLDMITIAHLLTIIRRAIQMLEKKQYAEALELLKEAIRDLDAEE